MVFIIVLFIVMRKILVFEYELDQKKVYIKKKFRNTEKNYFLLMLNNN
jgi:hypothetical protein